MLSDRGSIPLISTKKEHHPDGVVFLFGIGIQMTGNRTHLNATVRWTVAATSSKTGCYLFLDGSPHLHQIRTPPTRVALLFGIGIQMTGNRTHLNATVRRTVAATSSKTGRCLFPADSSHLHNPVKLILIDFFGIVCYNQPLKRNVNLRCLYATGFRNKMIPSKGRGKYAK